MRTFDVCTSTGEQLIVTVADNEQVEYADGWFMVQYGENLGRVKAAFYRPSKVVERPEDIPMIQTWTGRPLDQLLPDERVEAFDFATAEHGAGRMDYGKMQDIHRALRDAQKTSICPQSSDGKHDFSSQGCPAGVQACLHCEEVEL